MNTAASSPSIAVLDYGIGNLRSAQKALEFVGADARLTAKPVDVRAADGVVLPGVGAFGACMKALRLSGIEQLVHESIDGDIPFLGICVGMQMLFEGSDESPEVDGLGVFGGRIRWLPDGVKRPQMQWNQLSVMDQDAEGSGASELSRRLTAGLNDQWMYFVHSLAAESTEDTVATAQYGGPVTAAAGRDNIFATQFHPEKSATAGLSLLGRFVDFCGGAQDRPRSL